MTRVLQFPSGSDAKRSALKTDVSAKSRCRLSVPLSVVQAILPSGEKLPVDIAP